jgi:hypothetical protein
MYLVVNINKIKTILRILTQLFVGLIYKLPVGLETLSLIWNRKFTILLKTFTSQLLLIYPVIYL